MVWWTSYNDHHACFPGTLGLLIWRTDSSRYSFATLISAGPLEHSNVFTVVLPGGCYPRYSMRYARVRRIRFPWPEILSDVLLCDLVRLSTRSRQPSMVYALPGAMALFSMALYSLARRLRQTFGSLVCRESTAALGIRSRCTDYSPCRAQIR